MVQMAGADHGMNISGLSDIGVSPGRRFQPLILGLAVAIWALTHFTGHDSRDPSGLTLARQPGHSSACCGDAGGRLPIPANFSQAQAYPVPLFNVPDGVAELPAPLPTTFVTAQVDQ
ncbi:hypothetical protein EMIT0215P_30363 [Pseudomonas serboccidentalis]